MRFYVVPLAVSVMMASGARAGVADKLTADQVKQLQSGEMVVESENVPGGVWPKVTVYTLVKASIPTITAVLKDYAHAQEFQPSIVSAKVVAQPAPDVFDVEYTQKLPLFGTTTFSVQNTFKESDDGLSVNWTLLKSSMADASEGSLRSEPYGKSSILRYVNYVKPKLGALAGMAKSAALDSVKTTVTELKAEAERRAKK